jgi:quercetin dioxygenase-like cupin family protein
MKVIPLKDVPKTPVAMEGARGACKQVPLSKADGAPHFVFRVFTLEPGGFTPFHSHESEHLNFVIEGEGSLVDEHGVGTDLEAGSFAMVLPHEKHQYRNRSADRPFVMICAVPKEYE